MSRIILLSTITILFFSCSNSNKCSYINDYYQNVYLAEQAYFLEDYQKVVELMDKACSKCEVLNQSEISELYNYAEAAARIGKDDKAIQLVKKLLLRGYEIEQLSKNEAFAHLLNTKEWQNLETEYEQLHQSYLNGINIDLRKQISKMVKADQSNRKKLNIPRINKDSIWLIINKTDSLNDLQFKEIIKTYGYPNESIIGDYRIDQQYLDPKILLFHFDDLEYYSNTLKDLIDKGKAPPISLGNFVDSYQRRIKDQKKFIYGIYKNAGKDQIIDYENLDQRRVSIGLPPIHLKNTVDSLKQAYYNL